MEEPIKNGNGFTTRELMQFVLDELREINNKLDKKADKDDLTSLTLRVLAQGDQLIELKAVKRQEDKDADSNKTGSVYNKLIWIPTTASLLAAVISVGAAWFVSVR